MENKIRVVEVGYNEGLTGTSQEIEQLTNLMLRMRRVQYNWDKKLMKIEDQDLIVKWITIPDQQEEGGEEQEPREESGNE